MILRIFAAREPAKPLNDAQMCGSFLFLYVYMSAQPLPIGASGMGIDVTKITLLL